MLCFGQLYIFKFDNCLVSILQVKGWPAFQVFYNSSNLFLRIFYNIQC